MTNTKHITLNGGVTIKISGEVYNCLVNQALVMKHDSNESSGEIARKVVEEYFRNDKLEDAAKEEFISKLMHILGK
ncbi:MAG: hypothetical protein Q8930_18125 [Bacillota bacterium]|nr:hypothetical protein [Bacillota bacterium]